MSDSPAVESALRATANLLTAKPDKSDTQRALLLIISRMLGDPAQADVTPPTSFAAGAPGPGTVELAHLAAALKPSTAAPGDLALRALGSGSAQATAGDDPRLPTLGQKNALAGSAGTPGASNQFVTAQDGRLTDARPPLSHGHQQSEINGLVTALGAKANASHTHPASDITGLASSAVERWTPLFDSHVNLSAATVGLYPGHRSATEDLLSTAASPAQFAVVTHRVDPADYAATGKTMQMRVVMSVLQNAVANAAAAVLTGGLYPVAPGGATTTFLPTYGTVVPSSTAAASAIAASADSRVVSSAFTAPAADTYALAVAVTGATTAGATRLGLRLEYRYV